MISADPERYVRKKITERMVPRAKTARTITRRWTAYNFVTSEITDPIDIPQDNPWDRGAKELEARLEASRFALVPQDRLLLPPSHMNICGYDDRTVDLTRIQATIACLRVTENRWWISTDGKLIVDSSIGNASGTRRHHIKTLQSQRMLSYRVVGIHNLWALLPRVVLVCSMLGLHCWLSHDLGLTFAGTNSDDRTPLSVVRFVLSLDRVPISEIDLIVQRMNRSFGDPQVQLCIRYIPTKCCPRESWVDIMHRYELVCVRFVPLKGMIVVGIRTQVEAAAKRYEYVKPLWLDRCAFGDLDSPEACKWLNTGKMAVKNMVVRVQRNAVSIIIGTKKVNDQWTRLQALRKVTSLENIDVRERKRGDAAILDITGTQSAIQKALGLIKRMERVQVPLYLLDKPRVEISCSQAPIYRTRDICDNYDAHYVRWRRRDRMLVVCYTKATNVQGIRDLVRSYAEE